jgi:hypothetical protein
MEGDNEAFDQAEQRHDAFREATRPPAEVATFECQR